ncbi:proton-conducting transporter transmembrane domain-containing protein [Anaeromyxobacter diazotrophicus]|uniref:Hydrogenase n=1 Tax=Anaeromyxobacter diazotrophicus TaxID=2590199 RepID=A0A7I9VKF5_9BACT|nr:proton-conducting transporter membrane subunit [Anaeromyxobacter diazotrophicus]GEJ56896.1 hydrogenase [Anaeromyxobacter diazotrophicus]
MTLHLAALALLLLGGLAALALGRWPALALRAGTASAVAGSALGLAAALAALAGGGEQLFTLPWTAPLAAFRVGLDPLSAFFEVALFALAIPAAIFGHAYMRPHLGRRGLPGFLFFQNLLLAAMALVFSARQAVLFLVAWEVMAAASFLLVVFEHEDAEVRGAGLVYLVASHLGTAFLFALFVLLGRQAGSFDFEAFAAARGAGPAVPAALLFALAVVGFGTKAGLVPLHVWLPEAHPAAPSHISALLSGVMIKTGVYGILRALLWLAPAPAGFGLVLGGVGLAGALAAITLALGQRDVKRVLAYSSVENVGIIALGVGLAVAAGARGEPAVAALAWAGALLHVWNHAFMKGLAFMGAGAVAHAAHGRDLERMGGLLARLPRTASLFLLGLAALAALPPLNGFSSEWLVYLGLLRTAATAPGGASIVAWVAVATLAFVGGVAALAFARLGGIALLGEPRSPEAAAAHEPSRGLWAPLAALAALCAALGLFPDLALRLAAPALAQVGGARAAAHLAPAVHALAVPVRLGFAALLLVAGALALFARRARRGRPVAASETWGCGFTRPSPRVQYTGASFGQLFLSGLAPRLLQPRGRVVPPKGVLPARASARFEARDPARTRLFDPLFRAFGDRASRLRRYQAQRLNLQLVYTVATLLAFAALLVLRAP